ncbi:MAG TPA: SMI1/KNR4 family protein [Candidatus Flavonifractor merdigallinarum]|uniref:SMI1/KNR4 family protein n=1 Tax=Candidatus Flavonifractor merdigallinarum TaxID=2838589 RepID=A0A9D2BZP3_9FIRM|nr:SMI1/KNR4 family protein [Candidatus Flavonifractor merdigallinarum]
MDLEQVQAESKALQEGPVEPFVAQLKQMCRAAFGMDWTPPAVDAAGMEKLRSYSFLPEAVFAFYETVGGEERLWKQGLYPVERIEPDSSKAASDESQNLIYYKSREGELWAFSNRKCRTPCSGILSDGPGYHLYWMPVQPGQTLHAILVRQVGRMLSQWMPNRVWVKLPSTRQKGHTAYQRAAAQLGLTALNEDGKFGWDYACDEQRGLLMDYLIDRQKKCLVYSATPEALEALEQDFEVVWEKRNGEKILDPATFLQTPPPQTFEEKLDMMREILLGKRRMDLPMEEIEKAEKRLGMVFPEPLRAFYQRFGKGGKLMSTESLHTIYTPKELQTYTVEDEDSDEYEGYTEEELTALGGDLVLAEENQAVWWCRLDRETGEPYLDYGDGERMEMDMGLEGTLLWLLAQQSLGCLANGGDCALEQTPENRAWMEHYFHYLAEGKWEVFVNPERGIIGSRTDENSICIAGRRGTELDKLERDTGLQISYF